MSVEPGAAAGLRWPGRIIGDPHALRARSVAESAPMDMKDSVSPSMRLRLYEDSDAATT